ncbi:MAG: hypothetical protein M1819_000882 [Sarea resinae]|nr:MAG: hypothetical protein M1819_000882 [Sarea resinae]
MALCARRGAVAFFQFPAPSSICIRSFSTSPRVFAAVRGDTQLPQQRQPAERSFKIAMKEMERDASQLPNDLGLLPDTFVPPTGQNRIDFINNPKYLPTLVWLRVKNLWQNYFSLILARIFIQKNLKLQFLKTKPTAVDLHRQMYTAFAEGNTALLRRICADGLFESFSARIAARKRTGLRWTLHKYNRGVRCVSDRYTQLPIEGAGIRQAVVRIPSRQSLTKLAADGTTVPGSGRERNLVEYVVIQKRIIKGKDEPWMVWGTTEETTLKTVHEEERQKKLGM